jgi:NADH-quinone oxidoreductase subunit E
LFRGTAFAIGEIIWWCLASLLIGFLIGWIMRRWFLRDTLRREFETRLAGERANTARFQTALADRDAEVTALLSELKAARERADTSDEEQRSAAGKLRDRIAELEAERAPVPGAVEPAGAAGAQERGAGGVPIPTRQQGPARAAYVVVPFEPRPDPMPEIADAPTKADAVAMMAAIAERTRGGAPPVDDDLKLIRGIGPKIEGLLKAMGVTSFRQVASFDSGDVATVAAALESFPDRIVRDDWMTGAAEQHRLKYDEML